MPWIDPKKEIEADAIAIQNRIKSRQTVIRERGYDPEIIDQQIQADMFANNDLRIQIDNTDVGEDDED